MAKTSSRKRPEAQGTTSKSKVQKDPKTLKNAQKRPETPSPAKSHLKNPKFGRKILAQKSKFQTERAKHIHLHRSFRRSYREDYLRETKTPGLLSHAMLTFREFFRHWRTFGLLIVLMVVLYTLFVGLMSEEFYQAYKDTVESSSLQLAGGEASSFLKASVLLITTITSGGLDVGMGDAQTILMILLFLMMWLVVIFLLRHYLIGEEPRLRDGLYNAFGPLFSTFLIFLLIFIQCIPIMLVIITYAAALATDFLATPFYALVYFIFAAVMILLSGYLLSSSIIALVATTAPGMYPMKALYSASDLMASRRIKFCIRLIYLFVVLMLIYIVIMLPIIMLDLWLKGIWEWLEGWPIVPFCLLVVTCFAFVYLTIYVYLYYRWLLDNDVKVNQSKTT